MPGIQESIITETEQDSEIASEQQDTSFALQNLAEDTHQLMRHLASAQRVHVNNVNILELVTNLHERKKALWNSCTQRERDCLQQIFKEIFSLLITSHCFRPLDGRSIFSTFDYSDKEKLQIIEELIKSSYSDSTEHRHHISELMRSLKHLDLPLEYRILVAQALIRNGRSIVSQIDAFDFQSEAIKKKILIEELLCDDVLQDLVSYQMNFLQLSSEQDRIEIALAAAVKGISVAEYIGNYQITDSNAIYQIFVKCAEHRDDTLLPFLKKVSLPEKLYIDIAKRVAENSLSGDFIEDWDELEIDPETTFEIILPIVKTNPAIIYNKWTALKTLLSNEMLSIIEKELPYFDLQKRIDDLLGLSEISYKEVHHELEEILHQIHELNKTIGIPLDLRKLIRNIAIKCDYDELIELTHLINRYFFDKSLFLLGEICHLIEDKLPLLNELVTTSSYSLAPLYIIPFLTVKGANLITEAKLAKRCLRKFTLLPPCKHTRLVDEITQFYNSTHSQALLTTYFSIAIRKHSSLLILERYKDSLKIISTDSTSSDGTGFSGLILDELKRLEIPFETYILSEWRQSDTISCPIFSIVDSCESEKTIENRDEYLFEYFETNSIIESALINGLQIRKIVTPPAHMMKMVQSMTKIQELSELTLPKNGSNILFKEYVEKHCFILEDDSDGSATYKKVNLLAQRKAAKYFEKLLIFAIRNQREETTE